MRRSSRVSSCCLRFSWLAALLLPLVAWTSANGSFRTFQWIEPTDYSSLSGRFVLHVDPEDRFGAGAATYTMADRGKILWRRRHEFTLFNAAVTDGGNVVGYAYSGGPSGRDEKVLGPGSFSVILLDERGEVASRDRLMRWYTGTSSTNPIPEADEIVLNEPAGLFVVRVPRAAEPIEPSKDRFTYRPEHQNGERLWIYDLATGERQRILAPKDIRFPKEADSERLGNDPFRDLRAVPNTNLFLLHCDYLEWDEQFETYTSWPNYALIDADGRVTWNTAFRPKRKRPPRDSSESLESLIESINARALEPQEERPEKPRGILGVEPSGFEAIFSEASQRVTFHIETSRDDKGETRYIVRETARTEYVPPKEEAAEPLELAELPCPVFPPIRLGGEKADATPTVRGVASFAFDGAGRICLLRAELSRFEIVKSPVLALMDQEGRTLHEFDLSEYCDEHGQFTPSNVACTGVRRFVLFENAFYPDKNAKLFIADFEKKTLRVAEVEGCQSVNRVASFPDGHFVGAAEMMLGNALYYGLYYFDPTGEIKWVKSEKSNYVRDDDIRRVEGITTNGKDRIALTQSVDSIHEFDRDGKFLRLIELRDLWDRKINYITDIEFLPGRGYLIADYKNTPTPIIETDPDGRYVDDYAPVFEDGREVSIHGGIQIAPDGTEWTTDGDSIYRLDAKTHTVDRVLGRPIDADVLADPTNIVCQGPDETIHIADRRSLAVHCFGADGQRRNVARPAPGDIPPSSVPKFVGVSHTGDVFLRTDAHDRAYFGLAPDARPGPMPPLPTLRDEWDRGRWHFSRNSDRCWIVDGHQMKLADLSGKTLREIARGVNNRWLSIWAVAIADDGSLAALTYERAEERFGLHTFSADGEPLTFTLLKGPAYSLRRQYTAYPWVANSPHMHRLAFDGRRAYIAMRKEVHVWTLDGEPIGQIVFATEEEELRPVEPMVAAGGRELWLVDGESLVVRRFDVTGI